VQAGHDDMRVPPDLERQRVERTVAMIKAQAPQVRSAVVAAARDEVLGQRPVAYVVPGTDPGGPDLADLADALRAACSAALPRSKRPTAFCLVPELPVGATGKVSRRRLRELAAAPG
jgi:acyl-CoA synthetase (AMP-forming)/AMP-acid ligase II